MFDDDWLGISSSETSKIAGLLDEFKERESLIERICASSSMTKKSNMPVNYYLTSSIPHLRASAPLIADACSCLAKKTGIGNGYFIELRDFFEYPSFLVAGPGGGGHHTDGFRGLFLTLVDRKSRFVGMLKFEVGIPFEITAMQGDREREPGDFPERAKKFYKATGKPFAIALLDHFIRCVGASVRFKEGDPQRKLPKAIFAFTEKPGEKTMKQIAGYLHRRDQQAFIDSSKDSWDTKRFPLRGKPFFKAYRKTHGKINLPQTKKQLLPG